MTIEWRNFIALLGCAQRTSYSTTQMALMGDHINLFVLYIMYCSHHNNTMYIIQPYGYAISQCFFFFRVHVRQNCTFLFIKTRDNNTFASGRHYDFPKGPSKSAKSSKEISQSIGSFQNYATLIPLGPLYVGTYRQSVMQWVLPRITSVKVILYYYMQVYD